MRKKILLMPLLVGLLLVGCNDKPSSETPVSETPTSVETSVEDSEVIASSETPVASNVKYDLNDVVRTPYDSSSGDTKFAVGGFATFLKTKLVSGVENLVSSSNEDNIYLGERSGAETGPQFNGIKIGSSSVNAAVTLNFKAGSNITKVVFGAAGWYVNEDALIVNDVSKVLAQGAVDAVVEEVEYSFATPVDTLNITTSPSGQRKSGRVVINYIQVYYN